MMRYGRRSALILGPLFLCLPVLGSEVTGFLTDPALKPFPKAAVAFTAPDTDFPAARYFDVTDKGTFRVDPGSSRVFILKFIAPFCEPRSVAVYLPKDGPLKLDVRLKPYAWVDDLKDVRVVGDFNGFDFTTGVPLRALSDGTWFADVESETDGLMAYGLAYLVRGDPVTVPGTADEITLDSNGDYVSRLKVKPGKVRIVFDPALLPRVFGKAEVIFEHPDSTTAKVAAIYDEMLKRQMGHFIALQAFMGGGHDFKDFRYDWREQVDALRKRIGTEKDDLARQALWIALLDLRRLGSADVDPAAAQKALKAIPPESELWRLGVQYLVFDTIRLAGGLERYRDYFEKVITRNPSRVVRAFTLERGYLVARRDKDEARAQRYYRLLTEDYGDLVPGQRVKGMPPRTK